MRDILVAASISAAGVVDSRVKLQKIVFLLQRRGFDMGFHDFSLHAFGPFSADLAATVDYLSQGIVQETETLKGCMRRYSYTVNRAFEKVLNPVVQARFGESSKTFCATAAKLATYSRGVLELAATAAYLRDEAGVHDADQLWTEVGGLKPNLARSMKKAQALLMELGQGTEDAPKPGTLAA